MALRLPHRQLRSYQDRELLVGAVFEADPNDETIAVEWKRELDLAAPHGYVHVARAILGMANRDPGDASRHCGGLGFVVVGVAPGEARGVQTVDHGDLSRNLAKYLGSGAQAPGHSADWILFQGVSVLVVTVEPPSAGDRIFTLRKEATIDVERPGGASKRSTFRSGTIFVRHPGRTDQAQAEDIDRLQDRLLDRGREGAAVTVVATHGRLPRAHQAPKEHAAKLVAFRASELLAQAEQSLKPAEAKEWNPAAAIIAGINNPLVNGLPDRRSIEEFREDVAEWVEVACDPIYDQMLEQLAVNGLGEVSVALTNDTDEPITGVQLRLQLPDGVEGFTPEDVGFKGLEHPPRPFGERTRDLLGLSFMPSAPVVPVSHAADPNRRWIRDGSTVIVELESLRARETAWADPFHVLLSPGGESLQCPWEVRTSSNPGVLTGELELQPDYLDLDLDGWLKLALAD